MSLPDWARVEVAFGTTPDSTTPAWTDISGYVDALQGYSASHGRTDQFSNATAGQASYTLNNRDGRFTAEYAGGAFYPNVVLATRTRISYRQQTGGSAGNPIVTVPGNMIPITFADCDSTIGWTTIGSSPPAIATDTTHVQNPPNAMKFTWATGATQTGGAQRQQSGFVIGRTYTYSLYAYVPSGGAPPIVGFISGVGFTAASAVTNAYTRLSMTFVATATTHTMGILNNGASTAGQLAWVDCLMIDEGSTLTTWNTTTPPIGYRYDGCIDTWPVHWAPTGVYSEAQVTASDRLKRMGTRTLPDIISCEYRLNSPSAHYTLGDAAGSVTAGNSAPVTAPNMTVGQRGAGGTLTFGTATGPATDGLTAAAFVAASATNGKYLTMSNGAGVVSNVNNAVTLECWLLTSSATNQYLMSAVDAYGSSFNLQITAGSKLQGQFLDSGGVLTTTQTSAASCTDGLTHHAVLTINLGGGTAVVQVWLDGTPTLTSTYSTPFLILPTAFYVGGGPALPMFTGTLAHVALYASDISATSSVAAHYAAGTTGFAGERSDQRITRLAQYAGINSADIVTAENGSSSLDAQDTADAQALDLINAASTTENGVAFFQANGSLGIQGRSHRYNRALAITLGAGEYSTDLTPILDDFGVQNDVTAARANGVTVRVVNQASVNAIGTYTGQLDLICNSDGEVLDAANWRVNTQGTPAVRYPQVTVDLGSVSAATALAVLALEVGDRIAMSGLPSTSPTGTPDLYIEGWTENYTATSWTITFNCSRVRLKSVWTLDNTSFSVLDSTTRLAY